MYTHGTVSDTVLLSLVPVLLSLGPTYGQMKENTVPNSAKQCQTVPKPHEIALFTRIYPYLPVFHPYYPRYTPVFYTPRFSYGVLETAICTCPSGPVTRWWCALTLTRGWSVGPECAYRVGIPGGCTGCYTDHRAPRARTR